MVIPMYPPPQKKKNIGGLGAPLIGTPISHFIGSSESVKILVVQGIMAT